MSRIVPGTAAPPGTPPSGPGPGHRPRALLISALLAAPLPLWAQDDCRAADGACAPLQASRFGGGAQGAGQNHDSAPDLGEIGFSISVEGPTAGSGAGAARRTLAGAPAARAPSQRTDRLLDEAGVKLSYGGLGARTRLAVLTSDLRRSYAPGEQISFRSSSNYPAWIARAEVVIRNEAGDTVAVLPVPPNGQVGWTMPQPPLREGARPPRYSYVLQAFDTAGRRDETRAGFLSTAATPGRAADLTGPVIAAGEGEDMTRRRGIPVQGAAITVSGRAGTGQTVSVLGEPVPVDGSGGFVVQRILPPGRHLVAIEVNGHKYDRPVTIAASEWFATGIVDVTAGHDEEGGWQSGRISGFAEGTLANGTRITGSVDTREQELRDLFRDFGAKFPDQTLRKMEAQEVFNTLGDDSVSRELAPTSGRLYLRVERQGSHLTWGDFKPAESTDLTVRSDRALYGLSGSLVGPEVTSRGEPRMRISGFAAQADTLMQRDVMRATGGTAYFLSRQDIEPGTEVVSVVVRSRTTGLVVQNIRLAEGSDYRLNPVQGVLLLAKPLSAGVPGEGLINRNPLGDHDVDVVVQYEYVPTSGNVDGYTAGLRGEYWVNDHIRLGGSVLRETTGIADTTLAGVDLLLRDGETRELKFDYARSEGPGFGSSFSLSGGLDLEPMTPSYGLPGQKAASWRIAGKSDLAFFGLAGELRGFYDRKQAGFSSPDENIQYDQRAWGLSGHLALGPRAALTFGAEGLSRADGRREELARLGLKHQLSPRWLLEAEVAHDLRDAQTATRDIGRRTDAALRLTWQRDADLSLWVFGQATVARDDRRAKNDRIGIGGSWRLNERIEVLAEVSDGSLGPAGRFELDYHPTPDSSTTIGYRLDPLRRFDSSNFSGRDRGSWVVGRNVRVNDRWSYTAEGLYSAFGSRPSLAQGYGVTYTPDPRWRFDGLIEAGETVEEDGHKLKRRGLSVGMKYAEGEEMRAALRGEVLVQSSTRPGGALDRRTYLLAGSYEARVSEDWRFLSALDLVWSRSDQTAFRDGRYAELRLGYAWRPVANDRLNALLSYTYLYDLPGADQVNIDGDLAGPTQRSHIFNAALSYQLSPRWTLGAKYGYRSRKSAPRGTRDFVTSEAHLGVLRLDYHLVKSWDIMAEVRGLYLPSSKTREQAALLGVYRQFGPNLRVGGGYLWGTVSDDLRRIKPARTGFFVNVTSQF